MQKTDSGSLLLGVIVVAVPVAMAAWQLLEAWCTPQPKKSAWQKFCAWLRERKEIFQLEWEVHKFAYTKN